MTWPATTVHVDDSVLHAMKLLVHDHAPAVVVLEGGGGPLAVITGAQLLASTLPEAVPEDTPIAAAVSGALEGETRTRASVILLEDILPGRPAPLAVVDPDADAMQMAALMVRTGSVLVLVVEHEGGQPHLVGTVDAHTLLRRHL